MTNTTPLTGQQMQDAIPSWNPGLVFPNDGLNPINPNAQGGKDNQGNIFTNPGAVGIGGGAFGGVAPFLSALSRPDFWMRAGIVVAGIGLVIVGVIVLVSSSKLVGDALTAAGKASKLTPVGAATNVATEALT